MFDFSTQICILKFSFSFLFIKQMASIEDRSESDITVPSEEAVQIRPDHESIPINSKVDQQEPYTIFSKSLLIRLLIITSFTGMISPLTGSVYFPAVNQIQEVGILSLYVRNTRIQLELTHHVYTYRNLILQRNK